MHRNWIELLAAWLSPRRDFAWAHNPQTRHQNYAPMGWDRAFPSDFADDEELILYAVLIAAAQH